MAQSPYGRPRDLVRLKQYALRLDNQYWSYQDEKKKMTSSDQPSTSESNSTSRSKSKRPKTSSNSNPAPTSSSNPTSKSDRSKTRSGISETERQRRMTDGLCLYCGEAGHRRDACPKIPSSTGKGSTKPKTGRAAKVTIVESESESDSGSENDEATQ
jgi:hypothetical protein